MLPLEAAVAPAVAALLVHLEVLRRPVPGACHTGRGRRICAQSTRYAECKINWPPGTGCCGCTNPRVFWLRQELQTRENGSICARVGGGGGVLTRHDRDGHPLAQGGLGLTLAPPVVVTAASVAGGLQLVWLVSTAACTYIRNRNSNTMRFAGSTKGVMRTGKRTPACAAACAAQCGLPWRNDRQGAYERGEEKRIGERGNRHRGV